MAVHLWVPSEVLNAGHYEVAVCTETEDELHVILIGPPLFRELPHPRLGVDTVTVTRADGTALTWRGSSGRPSKRHDFVVNEYMPPGDTEYLEIRFTPEPRPDSDEDPVEIVTRVVRLT